MYNCTNVIDRLDRSNRLYKVEMVLIILSAKMDTKIYIVLSSLCVVFLASSLHIRLAGAAALPARQDSSQPIEFPDDSSDIDIGNSENMPDHQLRGLVWESEKLMYKLMPRWLIKWWLRRKEEKMKKQAAKEAKKLTKKFGF